MSTPQRVVIFGGSGFLGVSLAQHLTCAGAKVTVVARRAGPATTTRPSAPAPWSRATWDGRTLGPWADSLASADVIVNYTGRTVDCIKTPDHCDEILRSRVESTRVIGLALR